MGNSSTQAASSGIGVFGLLGVAFIVLKLIGVINWSWWWVTAPLWGPWALVLVVLVVIGVVMGLVALIAWIAETIAEKRRTERR